MLHGKTINPLAVGELRMRGMHGSLTEYLFTRGAYFPRARRSVKAEG